MVPGGIADKSGNTYEAKCAARYLLDVIQGQLLWLKYETIDAADHGVDFSVFDGAITTYYQVKRKAPNGNWTAKKLIAEGIIDTFFNKAKDSDKIQCRLITQSDTSNFSGIVENARLSNNITDFKNSLNEKQKIEYEEVFSDTEPEIPQLDKTETRAHIIKEQKEIYFVFNILKKLYVIFWPEESIDDDLKIISSLLFVQSDYPIFPILRDILDKNYNKKITTESIRSIINDTSSLQIKDWLLDATLPQRINEMTDSYISSYSPFGFDGSIIHRHQTDELYSEVTKDSYSGLTLLTGSAGSGKSGVVRQLIEKLRSENIPCLSFRIDQLIDIKTEEELGKVITNIDKSPITVLKGIYPDRSSVVIIDQVDAISEVSGRKGLLKEIIIRMVQKAIFYRTIKIILVCRTFDLENDPRLRMLEDDHKALKMSVPFLTWNDDIAPLLKEKGIDTSSYNEVQRKLLCVPINLSIFLRLEDRKSIYSTRKELFEKLIDEKSKIFRKQNFNFEMIEVLSEISQWMSEHQELEVPIECLDKYSSSIDILASEGLLVKTKTRLHYFHESFFDYIYARSFINQKMSIHSLLLSDEQFLFRRTQVRQILEHMRQSDIKRYLTELPQILIRRNIRYHIKLAVCQWLSTVEDPRLEEFNIILKLDRRQDVFNNLVASTFFSTDNWFPFLLSQNWYINELDKHLKRRSEHIIYWLMYHMRLSPDDIFTMIKNWHENNDEHALVIINNMKGLAIRTKPTDNSIYLLVTDLLENFTHIFYNNGGPDLVIEIINNSGIERINESVLLLEKTIKKWMVLYPENIPFESNSVKIFQNTHEIHEIIQRQPLIFINGTIDCFIDSVKKAVADTKIGKPHYDLFNRHESDYPYGFEEFVFLFRDALIKDSDINKNEVIKIISRFDPKIHETFMYLILEVIASLPEEMNEELLSLINIDTIFKAGLDGAEWLSFANAYKACCPYLSNETKEIIEDKILNYYPELERIKNLMGSIKTESESVKLRTRKDAKKLFYYVGRAQWSILETIKDEYLLNKSQLRLKELKRKFKGQEIAKPYMIQGGYVSSPINIENCKRMSDEQWISALKKYGDKYFPHYSVDFLKGGTTELGRVLMDLYKVDVERFSSLFVNIPDDIIKPYWHSILFGISQNEVIKKDIVITIIKRVHNYSEKIYGSEICDIIEKHVELSLHNEILDIIYYYTINGIENEEHEKELERVQESIISMNSILDNNPHIFTGYGDARCHAWRVITTILWKLPASFIKLRPIIESALDNEPLISVRCRMMEALTPIFNIDKDFFTIALRKIIVLPDISLYKNNQLSIAPIITYPGMNLFPYIMSQLPKLAEESIRKILSIKDDKIRLIGYFLTAQLYIVHGKKHFVFYFSYVNNVDKRKLVANIVGLTFGAAEKFDQCKKMLKGLLKDKDSDVRKQASKFLQNIENDQFGKYRDVIISYLRSPAFNEQNFTISQLLKNTNSDILDCIILIGNKLLKKTHNKENTYFHIDGLIELLKVNYVNTELYPKKRRKILDMIDKMLENNINNVYELLEAYER
ncbi:hypothetical protein AGMMS49942_21270 [Spirochaetia bacterium]|nr:hypothetical protein AGMMS49942_21270 [Spirochaetia bacterium]